MEARRLQQIFGTMGATESSAGAHSFARRTPELFGGSAPAVRAVRITNNTYFYLLKNGDSFSECTRFVHLRVNTKRNIWIH